MSSNGSLAAGIQWAQRVVNNGGATPTAAEITAVTTFYAGLSADGLLGLMLSVNVGATSSRLGFMTPLIATKGKSLWTDNGFANGAFGVNGLTGDQAHVAFPGVFGVDYPSDTNVGLTIYAYNLTGLNPSFDCGYINNAGNQSILVGLNSSGTTSGFLLTGNSSFYSNACPGNGYYSFNRVSSTDFRLFFGNSSTAHAQVGATYTNSIVSTRQNAEMWIGTLHNYDTGGTFGIANNTWSFWAFHQGLSLAQSALFFARVQTLKVALGGGFV